MNARDRDQHATVMLRYREWCRARGLGYAADLQALVEGRMAQDVPPLESPDPEPEDGFTRFLQALAAPTPAATPRPPLGRRPNEGMGRPGTWLVCDAFPGRLFSTAEAKAEAGGSCNVLRNARLGWKVGQRLYRIATEQEIDAALGAAAVHKSAPRSSTQGVRP